MNKVKMRKSVMKDFKRKAYMLLQKDWKEMKLSEKMRVVFIIAPYAMFIAARRRLRKVDWDRFGDVFASFWCGVWFPFAVWFFVSWINVISNNIFSPENIWDWNFFKVLTYLFP